MTQPSPTDPSPDGDTRYEQYVSFLVGDRAYGVDIIRVREIKQWTAPTALPNQPAHIRGVLNLRGTIVPVHDLRARFGGPLTEAGEMNVIVIVTLQERTIGILVDAVSDIITVALNDILAVPTTSGEADLKSLSGLVNTDAGMVALLNLDGLFPQTAPAAA
ncbi:MAG: chemotaxis protein CheW [Pseudomonadota bacterium]